MKKIFTLSTALFTLLSAFAQPNEAFRKQVNYQGKLSVSSMMASPVKVMIDGTMYNDRNSSDPAVMSDLRAGYHAVKIYQQKKNRFKNDWKSNKGMQLVYEGNIYVKPQYHVDITINRFGKAFVDERQMNGDYFSNDDNDWHGEWDNPVQAMNGRDFEQFKKVIQNEGFDNTKLAVAKQTIGANYFSAAQVKEIVQLFSFEGSKLDIAKYSYKYTIDQNNYFMLNDAFSFSSSKEELARFIQASR